jgi:hypothetical protein
MTEETHAYNVLVRNLKGRDCLGNLGICERIILKWILEELDVD